MRLCVSVDIEKTQNITNKPIDINPKIISIKFKKNENSSNFEPIIRISNKHDYATIGLQTKFENKYKFKLKIFKISNLDKYLFKNNNFSQNIDYIFDKNKFKFIEIDLFYNKTEWETNNDLFSESEKYYIILTQPNNNINTTICICNCETN